MHQHNVYVQIITNGAPIVKENRMDEGDLQLYVSVAAYLRDVIYAFKEEWEGEGYKPKFRSARLEFHMAMVLTGGMFTDRNVQKVQKKFNVTWNHFVERVEVTDVLKHLSKIGRLHGRRRKRLLSLQAKKDRKRAQKGKFKERIHNAPGDPAEITPSRNLHGNTSEIVHVAGDTRKAPANHVGNVRAQKRGRSRKNQQATVEMAEGTHVDAGKSLIRHSDVSEPLQLFYEAQAHRKDLMGRGLVEGDALLVSTNLVSWMIERYRILVGIPLNAYLGGQLIPQSPDEYSHLTEDDYLEALGIERLYAALVNMEESPDHLNHLAHVLGRAVKGTNTLSDSKPNTQSLDPLPPTMLPIPIPPHWNRGLTRPTNNNVEPDGSNESTHTGDRDESVSDNVYTAKTAAVRDGTGDRKCSKPLNPTSGLSAAANKTPCVRSPRVIDLLQLKRLRKARWSKIRARHPPLKNMSRNPTSMITRRDYFLLRLWYDYPIMHGVRMSDLSSLASTVLNLNILHVCEKDDDCGANHIW
ncbi:hypothetical protein DFJ58DRAFT_848445 [Suillus subalutaceus]|uniref:uncharacterized protein n=1 Tax=Suillus subalutaceus TaxID=48586 RepID=UPI001B87DD47|nr:uncharacterized protein DFJ58DRAFT_848445 [Suillus subalutaceus]KAG1830495.1 hypothetical protein DFJ58DRAFT_848445 [Suillus subalutaceus]